MRASRQDINSVKGGIKVPIHLESERKCEDDDIHVMMISIADGKDKLKPGIIYYIDDTGKINKVSGEIQLRPWMGMDYIKSNVNKTILDLIWNNPKIVTAYRYRWTYEYVFNGKQYSNRTIMFETIFDMSVGKTMHDLIDLVKTIDVQKIMPVYNGIGPVWSNFNDEDLAKKFDRIVLKIFYPKYINKTTGDFDIEISIKSGKYKDQLGWLKSNVDELVKYVLFKIKNMKRLSNMIGSINLYRLSDITLRRDSMIELKFSYKKELEEIIRN